MDDGFFVIKNQFVQVEIFVFCIRSGFSFIDSIRFEEWTMWGLLIFLKLSCGLSIKMAFRLVNILQPMLKVGGIEWPIGFVLFWSSSTDLVLTSVFDHIRLVDPKLISIFTTIIALKIKHLKFRRKNTKEIQKKIKVLRKNPSKSLQVIVRQFESDSQFAGSPDLDEINDEGGDP